MGKCGSITSGVSDDLQHDKTVHGMAQRNTLTVKLVLAVNAVQGLMVTQLAAPKKVTVRNAVHLNNTQKDVSGIISSLRP